MNRVPNYCPAPTIAGEHWQSQSNASLPESHVLSIIELILKPNVDIMNTSSPVGLSWTSALRYVRTIPGCIAISWGSMRGNSSFLILLIQWDSGIAWKRFQNSMGISMFAPFLEKKPFNRAVLLQVDLDLLNSCGAVDFVTFTFDLFTSQEVRNEVDSSWKILTSRMLTWSNLPAWGQWLEVDVSKAQIPAAQKKTGTQYRIPNSVRRAADRQPICFVGLAPSICRERDRVVLEPRIGATLQHIASLADCGSISATFDMIREHLKTTPPLNYNITADATMNSSVQKSGIRRLFTNAVTCQYAGDSNLPLSSDQSAAKSTIGVQTGFRAYQTPCAWYTPMGHLNQHVQLPEGPVAPRSIRHEYNLDYYIIKFKPGLLGKGREYPFFDEELQTTFFEMRMKLVKHTMCDSVYWGRHADVTDMAGLFVYWNNSSESLSAPYSPFEIFTSLSPWLGGMSEVQRIPVTSPPSLFELGLIEFVTFFVPKDAPNYTAFEGIFYDFLRTTDLMQSAGARLATAGCAVGACWGSTAPGAESMSFVAAIEWQSSDARERSYRDFEEKSQSSYECVGSKIEALWNWTGGRVDSDLFVVAYLEAKLRRMKHPGMQGQCGNAGQ